MHSESESVSIEMKPFAIVYLFFEKSTSTGSILRVEAPDLETDGHLIVV